MGGGCTSPCVVYEVETLYIYLTHAVNEVDFVVTLYCFEIILRIYLACVKSNEAKITRRLLLQILCILLDNIPDSSGTAPFSVNVECSNKS